MNFSIQRQVGKDMSFQAAYLSTLTHRIPIAQELNYPVLSVGATTQNVDQQRPYLPGTLGSIVMADSILNSAYHGLQITGTKRFTDHFSAKGFYAFSKAWTW
jgi:hypothetical protein